MGTKTILLLGLVALCHSIHCPFRTDIISQDFAYDHQERWNKMGQCGTGQSQSPINIPRRTRETLVLPNLKFVNYAISPKKLLVINTGFTLALEVETEYESQLPRVSGGGLNGSYLFQKLWFHWGSEDNQGSEHSKSDAFFPLEAQLIHVNEDDHDDVAILSVLFQLSSDVNRALDPLIPILANVTRPGCQAEMPEPMPLTQLMPRGRQEFYRYQGSQTTPPCTENVVWTIFKNPVSITLKQLSQFRLLLRQELNGKFVPMVDNFRAIQASSHHDRQVYERVESGVTPLQSAPGLLALAPVLFIIVTSDMR